MSGRFSNRKILTSKPALDEYNQKYHELYFSLGDAATYKRLRIVESGLVSCFDDSNIYDPQKLQVMSLTKEGEVLGVTSFGIFTNSKRTESQNLYARIDLVITEKKWRGFGVARILVLSVLVYILELYRKRLYSISCLAAHEAIANILESISFTGDRRDEKGFTHETLSFEAIDPNEYFTVRKSELEDNLDKCYQKLYKK